MKRQLLIMGAMVAIPTSTYAAEIVSSVSDFEPRVRQSTGDFNPGASTDATSLRVGDSSSFDFNAAYFFQLPDVAVTDITSANLSLTQVASVGDVPTYNADLYGIGFTNVDPPANTATESQLYFFIGDNDAQTGVGGPTVTRTKLQDNILTPTDHIIAGSAAFETSASGDTALLNYISSLYADPNFIPGSSYLILRLNPDLAPLPDTTTRYTIAAAEAGDATVPVLQLTVIPEPSSLALFGFGGLGLLARRRRRA